MGLEACAKDGNFTEAELLVNQIEAEVERLKQYRATLVAS
jgi:hypothetical protein